MAAIRFWVDSFTHARTGDPVVREMFAFDPGTGKEIIGQVDEGIRKQHPEEYAAFKNPEVVEVLAGKQEEVIEASEPVEVEEEEKPLITQTHNPTIKFEEEDR